MSITKPIKNDSGYLKEFKKNDELPNQPDIDEIKELLGLLVLELLEIGIKIEDEKLIQLLENIQK